MKYLDTNPLHILPTINSKNGYKTYFGGINSLIIMILAILGFYAFGKDIFLRQTPAVSYADTFLDYPEVDLTSLIFSVSVALPGGKLLPNYIDYVQYRLRIADTDNSRTNNVTIFTYINLVPCDQTQIYKNNTYNISNYFTMNAYDMYCLPDNNKELKNISGVFGAKKFITWFIEVITCNSTINPKCKTKNELINTYPSFYLQFYMNDIYVKSSDYLSPINTYINGRLMYLSSQFFRTDTYYLETLQYSSDDGILLENKKSINSFGIRNIESNSIYDPTNIIIGRVQLTNSNIGKMIIRSYVTLQKIVADVGGILKVLIMIIGFVSKEYSLFHFYVSLFNNENWNKSKEIKIKGISLNNLKIGNKNIEIKEEGNNIIIHNNKQANLGEQNSSFKHLNKLNNYYESKNFNQEAGYSLFNFIRFISPLNCMKNDLIVKLKILVAEFKKIYEVNTIFTCLRDYNPLIREQINK